jgi:O-antigen ligase
MKAFNFADLPWSGLCAMWLLLMILIGGISTPSQITILVHSATSIMLAGAALWRLRNGFPGRMAVAGTSLAIAAFLLVSSHLVPLPPSIWQVLPGRELVVETARLNDASNLVWMPLSLAPQMTRLTLLAMLPMFATFLAILTVDRKDLPVIGFVLVCSAILCVFIGLLQRGAPADSILHFYGMKGGHRASGTFANVNFFATQLFATIPFLAAIAMTLLDRFALRGWLVFGFVSAYAGVILAGLAVIGSRAGVLLAMLSVLLTVLVVFRSGNGNLNKKRSMLPIILIGIILIFGQLGMAALLQIADTDPLADYRSTMLGVSMEATKAFFPFGSGFGSFVPVYQMFESPDTMLSSYVNHVHNDWLEIAMEGGVPAVALLASFVLLFLLAFVGVFQIASDNSTNAYFRAATLALFLILLQSIIDFTLRTPANGCLAAACFGIMLTARATVRDLAPPVTRSSPREKAEELPVRPFSRPTRGFRSGSVSSVATIISQSQ